MAYTLIDISQVFIYKALPDNMRDRVLKFPVHMENLLPRPTNFPKIDSRLTKESLQSIDWKAFPERNLTQNSFIDTFAALVHQYGHQQTYFYIDKMNVDSSYELNVVMKVLCGIMAKDFIIGYTLKMIRDLQHRTNLNQKEIGEVLCFPSRYAILHFINRYAGKNCEW